MLAPCRRPVVAAASPVPLVQPAQAPAAMPAPPTDGVPATPMLPRRWVWADVCLQPIASKLVKEIALFGGDIEAFVSQAVCEDVVALRPG